MAPPPMHGISISDEDPDEIADKAKSRRRRKRKKPIFHRSAVAGGVLQGVLRILVKWWPALLLLVAIPLLVFESSSLIRKPAKPEIFPMEDLKEPPENLNRLDPVTRVIHGVREPCLKILRAEELHNLDLPVTVESNYPPKRLVYKSDFGKYHNGDNLAMLPKYTEATRFNLFTGYQTLDEREESFKMKETAEVHCGFYSESGGFKISDDDKKYMRTCKVVISTCAFGGGDDLYQPIGMTEASLNKVCYVAFWDEITRAAQEGEGKLIGDDHMIGKWRIVIVGGLPFSDQRLNGKIPKMLSHRLFPQARYSIWVDSKSQFRRDPLGVLEALLWRTNSTLAISEHGARSNLYDEAKAIVKKNKATPEEVEVQISQYRKDGTPGDKRLNGKKALAEASVIVREQTPLTNLFMCLWFNEVVRFTSRDQLSFPYVLWRLKMPGIHMFPVCTRRDLVNSMGHRRKVKPLLRVN